MGTWAKGAGAVQPPSPPCDTLPGSLWPLTSTSRPSREEGAQAALNASSSQSEKKPRYTGSSWFPSEKPWACESSGWAIPYPMEPTLLRLRLSALCLLLLMALALELSCTTGESLWASNPANKAETQGARDGEDGSGVRGIMLGLG